MQGDGCADLIVKLTLQYMVTLTHHNTHLEKLIDDGCTTECSESVLNDTL